MKPARKASIAPAATVEFSVDFGGKPRGRSAQITEAPPPAPRTQPAQEPAAALPIAAAPQPPPDVPAATKRLVVGYYLERLIESGAVKDYAEIARVTGLSRARVTQLADLLLLPAKEQERMIRGVD